MIDYTCTRILNGVTEVFPFQAANDLAAERHAVATWGVPGAYLRVERA